jgi:hypothetical protein
MSCFSDDNKPPVADAGPDVHIRWPTHYAELDGSKSFDDDKISYHWTVDHSSPATLVCSMALYIILKYPDNSVCVGH